MDLIQKWIEWNEKKITSHDFCMAFEEMFRREIKKTIKKKLQLKQKIERQMIRDEDEPTNPDHWLGRFYRR